MLRKRFRRRGGLKLFGELSPFLMRLPYTVCPNRSRVRMEVTDWSILGYMNHWSSTLTIITSNITITTLHLPLLSSLISSALVLLFQPAMIALRSISSAESVLP